MLNLEDNAALLHTLPVVRKKYGKAMKRCVGSGSPARILRRDSCGETVIRILN